MHSKLEQCEEADKIKESVLKVRREIDQLRKAMVKKPEKQDQEIRRESSPEITEGINHENANQFQYKLIKERANEVLEDSVHLDAIPLPGKTLPEEIIQTMQLEVVSSLPEEISETLTQIRVNEEISQPNDQEMENQRESLEEQMEEGDQQFSKCDEGIAEERDSGRVEMQAEEIVLSSKEQEKQVN